MPEQISTVDREVANTPVGAGTPIVKDEAALANQTHAKNVQAGAKLLADGFRKPGRKRGEPTYADDILDRTIFTALARDTQTNLSPEEWESAEKNVYEQGKLVINDLTDPANIDEQIDALATRLKAKAKAIRMCATTRVALKGGVPALQFGMVYVGFAPKRADLALTMIQAANGEASFTG